MTVLRRGDPATTNIEPSEAGCGAVARRSDRLLVGDWPNRVLTNPAVPRALRSAEYLDHTPSFASPWRTFPATEQTGFPVTLNGVTVSGCFGKLGTGRQQTVYAIGHNVAA